jgi:hypothetical protein
MTARSRHNGATSKQTIGMFYSLKIPEDNVTTAPGSSYPIESSDSSDEPPAGSSAPPRNDRKLIEMVMERELKPGTSLEPFAARTVAAHQSRRDNREAKNKEVNRSTALWALATLDPNFRRAFVESGLDVEGLAKGLGVSPDPHVSTDVKDATLDQRFAAAWDAYLKRPPTSRPIEATDVALAILNSAGRNTEGRFPGRTDEFGLDVPKAIQTFTWKVDTGWWPWEKRVDARPLSDDTTGPDQLGREILAAHADAALGALLGYGRATEPVRDYWCAQTRPVVLHIDGRWGSGKSQLVSIMLDPTQSGEAANGRRIRHPVVVNYDAWKESTVTPEWWSLGAQIVQSVHRERSLAGRLAMTLVGLASRIARSRALLFGLIAGLAVALLFLINAEAGQTLAKLTGAIGAIVTIGIVAGQALFWTAPAFGRLHLSSGDSVLASVATEVARVRRWGPRTTDLQRPTDTLCATCVVLAAALTLIAAAETWQWSWSRPMLAAGSLWWLPPALSGGCAALLWWACWSRREPAPEPTFDKAAKTDAKSIGELNKQRSWLPPVALPDLGAAMVAGYSRSHQRIASKDGATSTATTDSDDKTEPPSYPETATTTARFVAALSAFVIVGDLTLAGQDNPWSRAVAWSVLALLAFACWGLLAHVSTYPRRPMVALIDDLDRCRANRVTKLIETVHTLLRYNATPTGIASRARCPAPLGILVIGDGRWIRQAFLRDFEDFSSLGSDVHDLGADFVQKVFDHTVYVPSLSSAQRLTFTRRVTESNSLREGVEGEGPLSGGARDPDTPGANGEGTQEPGSMPGPTSAAIIKKKAAAQDAAMSDIEVVRDHLLSDFADVMPANPRLIKRVVIALLMLQAIKDTIDHQENDNAVARAAILSVRFPTLASDIISDTRPSSTIANSAPWTRPDVTQLLSSGESKTVPLSQHVESVARCLGRTQPFDVDAGPPADLRWRSDAVGPPRRPESGS